MDQNSVYRSLQKRPPPPPTLSKESIGVWTGWGNCGDKEVAREAAAKGTHIFLAITFLSKRKNVSYEEADDWFKAEVIKWVGELLQRKQIFKASHVFKNIGLEAANEFTKIFYSTCDGELRDYIGEHLVKIEAMDSHLGELWTFLKLILDNVVLILKFKLPKDSIECLDEQTSEWKSEIATTLFLKQQDDKLANFIQAETLWKHLLIKNHTEFIIKWINLRSKPIETVNDDLVIIRLFQKFVITPEMVNLVNNLAKSESSELILNEFSKFGVFCDDEKDNFLAILKRLKNSYSIAKLNHILTKASSVIDLDTFFKLLTNYCLGNNLYNVLNVALADYHVDSTISPQLALISDFRKLIASNFSENLLKQNIFNVSKMLSSENVEDYLIDNPMVFFALVFFTKNLNFIDLLTNQADFVVNDVNFNSVVVKIVEKFEILNNIVKIRLNGKFKCDLTIYDLLDRHLKIESSRMFNFRFNDDSVPHFNHAKLVEKYGYCKKIGYKFYLMQSRPTTAARCFILQQFESNNEVREDDLRKLEKKVEKIAINNFERSEITSACIVFLDLLKRNPTKLRIIVKSSQILQNAGYSNDSIFDILFNCDDEPYQLQNHLETILMEQIDSLNLQKGEDFIWALRIYEITIQYSKIANIKLPEQLLKYCASQNQWLPFLIIAQIHNYPLDQLKLLIQFFKSSNMLEHLTHGVINDIQIEEKNALIRDRDSRNYFLSRVGVRKNLELLSPTSSMKSQSSYASDTSGNSSDFFEIDISNIKATLLQTLIRCHNSTDPPKALLQACQLYRNPLLAIFATSYEPDSVVTNWLTWLAVSCNLCQTFTNYESISICANSVANLLEDALKNRYPKALFESFEIFLPDNPLKLFIDFLNDMICFNLQKSCELTKLDAFQSSLKSTRKNSVFNETDHEMTYLTNRVWIEMVAVRLLGAAIDYNCDSLHDQIMLLNYLNDLKFSNFIQLVDCPNFANLIQILKSLHQPNGGIAIKFEISMYFDAKTNRQSIVNCINLLLDKQLFETALEIARIEQLPSDLILIKQCQNKMNYKSDWNFWIECDRIFVENNVTADCVIDFYMEYAEKLNEAYEKFIVLKMAWTWASNYDLSCQYELEKKMWLSYLYLDEKNKNLDFLFEVRHQIYLYKDLCELLKNVCVHDGNNELSKDFQQQFEKIVIYVLNKGDFWLALRLQKMFRIKCNDLETLKLCHSLAEGILLPYQLNAEQRMLLSNVNYFRSGTRRGLLSTRLSSFSSSSHSPMNYSFAHTPSETLVESTANDTLAILKVLSEHLHSGIEIGQTIFMMYRISINIEIPYEVVTITQDHMKILKDSLEDDCMNKLDVVHDFIFVYNWNRATVADFICEELINATMNQLQDRSDQCILWDLNINTDFGVILQLLQDNCSVLGHKLYSYLNTLHKAQIESSSVLNSSNFNLLIELLVRAHDCFTADCNMEGISLILKKSKEVIANLLTLQDWKLIVRLTTGVARYTEMNYVFQILMENDQFEFLLRKDLRKDNALKVALLDYLKKFCPENKDLYKIVALHFTLFSEVAMLWEREAEVIVNNLITIAKMEMQNNKLIVEEEPFVLFQHTEGTKILLQKAMLNYKHATDFHLQGEKLTKAMESAKQAELIALQLGILNEIALKSSTICLLNLSNGQIASLISSKLSFEQGLILVKAYNFHADWSTVLYEQYIVRDNGEYFDAFLQHLPLTDTMANDISRKFVNSNVNSVNEIRAMKHLLSVLPSLHTKYRIASELGFTDLVEDLIATGQLVYLKDTVWKRGFKS